MTINALNAGAQVWLADLEDSNTPHWNNVVGGQLNLADAVRREISFTSSDGRAYALRNDDRLATIVEPGTIRATILIETIPAAFEMEEILYELRSYASALRERRTRGHVRGPFDPPGLRPHRLMRTARIRPSKLRRVR